VETFTAMLRYKQKKRSEYMRFILFLSLLLFMITDLPAQENEMQEKELAVATFAGGCFWCMEPPFDALEGVHSTISGYMGGHVIDPTYEEVSSGRTGHAEVVQVSYDPEIISYQELLAVFWRNIDPTTVNGQFADRGTQYRTAIFYHTPKQEEAARKSRDELASSGKFSEPIVTEIVPAEEFYRAEEYHQDYYKKNTIHYNMYKVGSGRAGYLKETWGKEKE
jgi:methionine-S-sulfoxide reductase